MTKNNREQQNWEEHMSTNEFKKVTTPSELPKVKILCVSVEEKELLLCHTADGIFAVDNLCTHAEARLCDGKLKGNKILCPLHGAAFDVKSGAALTRPASIPLKTYPVKLENETISVSLIEITE